MAVPLLTVLTVLALSSATGAGSSARTTGHPASRGSIELSTPEQAYLQGARLHGADGSNQAVLDSARNACAELNSGGDVSRVGYYLAQRDRLDDRDARVVLHAASHAYCPTRESRLAT